MRIARYAAFAAGLIVAPLAGLAATIYSDNFNNAVTSAANYTVVTSDATSSFPTYAYDYSALGIPSAPNSGGNTQGVRLDANFSAPNAAEAVTLHTLSSFTGDYTVKFDAWINVNGPFPDGGSGSTNYLTAGVGGDGATNNHVNNTGINGWTAVNGENGSGIDYRLLKGATLQGTATNQYAAGNYAAARNGLEPYYSQFGSVNVTNMPVQGSGNGGPVQQNGTSYAGSFGMAWHQVELQVDADGGTGGLPSVKWYADGLLLGTLDAGANGAFAANGALTLGYSDPTSNGSDLPSHSFALIDNLVVTDVIPEPGSIGLLIGAAAYVASRRGRRTR